MSFRLRQDPVRPRFACRSRRVGRAIPCLADAEQLLGDDGKAYKNAMLERNPDWCGASLIDVANQYLYGAQAD